ncbi:MAG TPA: hypothetical protein VMF29_06990, partial [Candidatus Edwardsbacteria bacterium]|nr:hypothetical protein [Candidatus Edwardsbacteria bacterium]
LDVWGGVCGGLLGALLLIPSRPAFVIAQCVGLSYLMPALLLALRSKRNVPALLSLILLVSFSLLVFTPLERISAGWLFPGQDVVATGISKYSQLAVVRDAGQYSLYENGQLAALWPDAIGAEERCLVPLSLVARPARVLLIGGGLADCALLASLPGVRTTYLEIDPQAWGLFYPRIGEAAQHLVYSASVDVVFADYRAFLNRYRGPKYDLALVNLPDPYNAGINRGYTRECFRALKEVLADSGVARLSIVSDENYLSPALRGLDGSILRTVAGCFPRTALLSGDRLVILASTANRLAVHPDTVMARLRRLGVAPRYLSREYLSSRILPDRIGFVGDQLARERAPENRDLRPVGYAYQLRLSSLLLKNGAFAGLLGRALDADWRILIALGLLFLIPLIKPGTRIPCAALAAGFAGMVALMAVLLAFQARQGYVYHLVALVSACYLAGLALGGAAPGTSRGSPALSLAGSSLVMLILIPLSSLRLAPLPLLALFCGCAALAGVCGGRALASLVTQGRGTAGTLYAFDLVGGAVGAVGFALWWLPAFGQTASLLAAAVLLVPVILLILPLTSRGN